MARRRRLVLQRGQGHAEIRKAMVPRDQLSSGPVYACIPHGSHSLQPCVRAADPLRQTEASEGLKGSGPKPTGDVGSEPR